MHHEYFCRSELISKDDKSFFLKGRYVDKETSMGRLAETQSATAVVIIQPGLDRR